MDLWKISCSSLVLVLSIVSLEAGYIRPRPDQWPWNSYTTTTASPGAEPVSTVSTTPVPLPPQVDVIDSFPSNVGNEDDSDIILITNPVTNEQFAVPRNIFLERFGGLNSQIPQPQEQESSQQEQTSPISNIASGQPVRCGHYFRKFCGSGSQQAQATTPTTTSTPVVDGQEQMETAASTFPRRVAFFEYNRANEVPTSLADNELYHYSHQYNNNNNYYRTPNSYPYRSINNYGHQQGPNGNLLRLIFPLYNPNTAIYSYSSIGKPASYPQISNEVETTGVRTTMRPRQPKLTSTWIPRIYRSSTIPSVTETTTETPTEQITEIELDTTSSTTMTTLAPTISDETTTTTVTPTVIPDETTGTTARVESEFLVSEFYPDYEDDKLAIHSK